MSIHQVPALLYGGGAAASAAVLQHFDD